MAEIRVSQGNGSMQFPPNAAASGLPPDNPMVINRQVKGQYQTYISDYNRPTNSVNMQTFQAGVRARNNPVTQTQTGAVSAPTVSQSQSFGSQPAAAMTAANAGSRVTSETVYDQISALENSYEQRRMRAAEDVWGKPVTVKNADGSTSLKWGTNGVNWLGMQPGDVYTPTFNRPAANAPYQEFVDYRNKLQGQVKVPLYSERSLNDVFDNMGIQGIAQFQQAAAKAGFYASNHRFAPGILSNEDFQVMNGLMSQANLNGMTWEDTLSMYLQTPVSGGRGGGGGGGGGGGVSTTLQYTQTSVADGRRLLNSVLTDALGRIPTDTEFTQFLRQLNNAESKSPTKTVTRRTAQGTVVQTSPSTVDSNQMAQQFAQNVEGGDPYRERQASDYMGLLSQRLMGSL